MNSSLVFYIGCVAACAAVLLMQYKKLKQTIKTIDAELCDSSEYDEIAGVTVDGKVIWGRTGAVPNPEVCVLHEQKVKQLETKETT